MLYLIIDNPFNKANYPHLINWFYVNPPSYAIVKVMPDPYRKFECWDCNHNWIAKVEFEGKTALSGESIEYCPKCNKKFSSASNWIQLNGEPYPFPEPIKF